MNKIFKVVWNRTIGSFVVTSELAKGRVKSSSEGAEGDVRASEEGRLKTLFRLTALSAALFGLSESAWAHPIINSTAPANTTGIVATGNASETAVGGGSARGVGSVAVGAFAKAGTRIEADGAVAIGGSQASTGAFADGNNAIAIGQASNANAAKAISIGSDTIASHEWTSAYGGRAEAKNLGATALGSWTQATGEYSIAIGGSNAQGRGANAGTLASGSRSTAIGRNAKSAGADAIALGTGAQATLTNSVAIGVNALATGVNNLVPKERANVGNAVAIGSGVQALGEDSVAIGVSAGATLTQATTKQSLAIGWTAKATGTAQAVAIGPDAIASGAQSTSIGNNTRATGDSSIAIGGDDWNIVREKTVAAAGNKQVHQIYQDLTGVEMKRQGVAYNNPFKGTTAGDAAVAVGVTALAEGVLSTAFGSGTSASGIGAAAFGVGASASQDKSVAIGAGSRTNTDATAVTTATVNGITYSGFAGTDHITPGSQVSFGSAGYERQLKHVAPGAITATSTDAVNGSQLYALHVGAGNIAKSVADALGGGATVGNDPTNNQGSFVTLPSYDVLKGNAEPNTAGNGTAKFNTTPARNIADALTNLNTYVNQGFTVKDNAGDAKGIVTPGESVQFADGNATTVTVDTEANGNTKIKYDVKVDDKTIKVVDGKLTGASQTHFYSVKNEDQTKGNYNNDGATGDNALAAGVDASATANGTTAVGLKAQASAESAIAVGSETKAAAKNAVVIGNKASVEAATDSVINVNGTTTGEGSVAVGAASKASGTNATAVGQAANAYGQNSFAGGQVSNAKGKSSVAVGDGANALNDSAVALGAYTTASNVGSTAVGFGSNALGWASFAGGHSAKAEASSAVALGHEAQAVGGKAVAIGKSSHAAKDSGIALGDGAKAAEVNAIAIGSTNNAWKEDSIALGRAANADGAASLALGLNSHTRLDNAIALGNGANADHSNSIAIGKSSHAAESAGVAIGNDARALKFSSVVIGDQAQSNNSRSVVIGYHASATNPAKPASAEEDYNQTVAIGAYANAWGDQSTAIGNNVDAKGNSSIAIGADDWDTVAVKTVEGTGKTVKEVYQDYTGDVMETGSYTHTTSSEAAVAIGTKSQAIGQLSTAFGTGTIAEGVASAAFGMGAKATQGNSVAIGAGSTTTTGATSVNEATVNNLKYSGFAGGNSVNPGDQVSFGSKNYERQLKNVAPGEISNTSTDAINGSQLYAVQNVLGNTAQTVKNVLGGDAAVDENGSITMSNIGNTGAGNIHDAIKSVKETAEKGWKLKANDEADSESEKIAAGDTVTVKQGKNIRVKRSSKELTIETADDVAFNKVTVGNSVLTTDGLTTPQVTAGDSVLGNNGLTIANGAANAPVSLTKDGLNNGGNKVTDVAKGTADTDAVNFSQLNPIAKALNTTVNPDGSIAAPNFTVKHADGTEGTPVHTVQDALDKVGEEVTKGINVGGTTGSNKYALGGTINIKGDSNIVSDTVEGGVQLKLADTVKIGQDSGKPVSIDGTTGTVSGLSNTTLGAAPLADSNKAATEAQLDATQVNLANVLGGNAANNNGNVTTSDIGGTGESNVHDAIKSVKATADKGWKLKANEEADSESEKIAAGDTVTVKQGKNIRVKRSGKELTIETADDVAFNKVTVGNSVLTTDGLTTPQVTAGDSVLGNNGLTIANGTAGSPVSLTKGGLNNGGNKVTNVAKGTADTDGVNVSQLNPVAKALNTNIDPTTGEVAAPSFTVTKADGTKHPAVGTVQDALDKVGEEVTKGLNIVADNGSSEKVNLGDTVKYTSKDKNIVTTSGTGKEIDFSLAEKVTIGKDAANGGKPVVIDGKEGIVSGLTNTTLGAAPLADSNKAATEAQLDATQVNLANVLGGNAANNNGNVTTSDIGGTGESNVHDAIKSVKATADKGWKLKANEEADSESEKIAAGDTVTVKQGKNIRVKRSGKELTIETADDVAFNKVTVGNSVLTTDGLTTPQVTAGDSVLGNNGLTIANGTAGSPVSLTKDGLNNGGNKVTNVAKGTADTDGVNVSQLNPVAKALNTNIDPTTGEVAAPSFTVTKADGTKHPAVGTVQDALDKVGEEVTKGLNIVADNGSSEKVNLGDTVKYTSKDKNIVTTSGTGKEIDFSLAEKVTIGKDAANGGKPVVIDGKEGIVSGLTNTTLGAAPLADSNKAATEAQLDATQVNLANVLGGNAANNNGNVTTSDIGGTGENNVHDAIKSVKATADKGWNLNANDETSSEKIGAGDTVTFKEGKNVKVSRNGKSITIATSDDVSFKTVTVGDSVLTDNGLTVGNGKAGKPVSLTKDGLNNGGNKIANVAAGEADTDAVNVAQLKAAAAKATSKVDSGNDNIVVTPEQNADGSTTYKVATAPNLKADSFTAGDTVVNNDGVKVGDKVALGKDGLKAGDVNITTDGINAGNKAISNVAEGKKDTDAVNVAQLKAAAAKATSKVESGNDNIVVTPEQNADGSITYKVATAPDLKADSLTTGDTVVNNDGVKVGDKVALTKDGLDNGGNKVANVAAGEADTDAVNVAQLKAAAAKATSKVESGNDNIVVTPEQNADGSTTYKVATAPDLKADSLTTGDTVVNNDGVKVGDKVALGKDGLKAGDVNITADGINAGNKAISNVAEGKKDTDAVNVGQLNRLTAAAKTEVEAGTNIASVSSKQGANKQTVYTINADGASVSAGSDKIVVTKGKKDANNVTDYAVDLSKAVKDDIAKGVAAKDAVDNKGISFAGDSGTTVANKLGDTVAVKGDANITTTAGANGIQVGLNKDLKVDSVTTGGVTVNAQGISIGAPTAYNPANTVSLSPNGLNNGGQRITNVAPAKEGTDAVNLNQLVGMGNALQNNIANVGKKAYAGVAGAIAQGSIPQVTRPGATGIGVGSGYYGGQSAMAIGVSAMSDGGNWIVKGNFSANTDGHVGVGAGALYQW